MKKVITIYGYRRFPLDNPEYAEMSILRGYSSLSDHLESLQSNNEGLTIYSTDFSSIQIGDMKTIFLTVLYSGEINWFRRGAKTRSDFVKKRLEDGAEPYSNLLHIPL